MDQKVCLASISDRMIRAGQYEYPFQFTIPNGAPASMQAGKGSSSCNINYSMQVWLDRPGFLRWDIRSTVYVNVANPPPVGNHTPLYIEPMQVPVHSCCCIHRGDILMGGSAESSIISAGGQSSVKYAVQNSSSVPIKAIEISIVEDISFSARGHHGRTYATLYHTRLSPAAAGLELALRPSKKGDANADFADLRALSSMLESDLYKLPFTVPSSARNTYNGCIVRVEHYFKIQVMTTMGTANPVISRPIKVFSQIRPEMLEPETSEKIPDAPMLPQNWAPAVAQPVELPPMALCFPVEHVEGEDNQPVVYVSATVYPAVEVFKNFDQFLASLSQGQGYDSCGKLERFIRTGNSIDALTPEQFYSMFRAVQDVFDQQRFADILSAAMTSVSCAKVARAAAGSKDMCRREVAEKLLAAGPLQDKGNSHLLQEVLTPFQFMTVEKYFQ
jgi:hypothetical protein